MRCMRAFHNEKYMIYVHTDTWWAVKLVAFQWEWISAFQYTARIAFFTSTTLSFGQWTTADEISIHKVKATLIHCGNDHLFTDHHTLFVFIFSVSSLLCFPLDSNSTKHFQRYHSFYLHKAILTTCVTLKSKWISFNKSFNIIYIISQLNYFTLLNWRYWEFQFTVWIGSANDINTVVDLLNRKWCKI